ncbi:MAG: cytochrome c-type biogenesis protein CcmH [Fidelibacterota bacterium]
MLEQKPGLVLTVALLLQTASPVSPYPGATLVQVKKSLICLCGCNMTVDACQGAMDCQTAENLVEEASLLVDQGMDRSGILGVMVQRYGERILSAPTKRGFNLTAWILPFLLIFVAALGIVTALKRWVGFRGKDDTSPSGPVDREYEEKLEKVLSDLG